MSEVPPVAATVVSLRSDRHGCVGALVAADGNPLAIARRRHPALQQFAGFQALGVDAVLTALHGVLQELAAASEGRTPAAIGITTPRSTAVLVGSENRWLSPVLFGIGAPLPARDVPSDFATPELSTLFRRSVVRQATEREPDAVVDLRRVVSLGALLYRELSGYWSDNQACAPTGAPLGGRHAGGYADEQAAWLATGIDPRTVPTLVPPGGVIAQLTSAVGRRYGWPGGVPLVATSDALGCAAYGLKSSATAWVVELGDGLRAGWCAPERKPETWSIQVIDASTGGARAAGEEESGSEGEEGGGGSIELSLEEASARVAERLGELTAVAPGPRSGHERFELATVEGLFDANVGPLYRESPLRIETAYQPVVGPALVRSAPLGCEGLRLVAGRETASLVGLRPGHGQAHLVRAALEGLCLELGRWRAVAGVLGADLPRVIVTRPWATELIEWVADVTGEPVAVWAREPELPSLVGQALAMLRELGLGEHAQPTLGLQVVEPGERVAAYRAHRAVYVAVREALEPVLG